MFLFEPYKQCMPPSHHVKMYLVATNIPLWLPEIEIPVCEQSPEPKQHLRGRDQQVTGFLERWPEFTAELLTAGECAAFFFENWGAARIFTVIIIIVIICLFYFILFFLQIAMKQQGLAQGLSCWDISGWTSRKVEERHINPSFSPYHCNVLLATGWEPQR